MTQAISASQAPGAVSAQRAVVSDADLPLGPPAPMATTGDVASRELRVELPPVASATEDPVDLSTPPQAPDDYPPGEHYIVISCDYNRIWLMRDGQVELAALCATGKGDTLVWEEGGKTWVFETPTGVFSVQYMTDRPRWVPPEWDYVERGEDPPDWLNRARSASYDMLGDYSINFGNDYNIHGTLFERLLGRSITHGCVRVGADDLAYIYRRAKKGTKIYIY